MDNLCIIKLLKKIKSLKEINDEAFKLILNQYKLDINIYEEKIKDAEKAKCLFEDVVDYFHSTDRNYFTISSKKDFNYLIKEKEVVDWEETLVFHPLNDHSRKYLKKNDILFCYRQGQLGTIEESQRLRGIYGIGVAATDPLKLWPDRNGHKQYGVVVCFPLLLNNHLELSNIIMHPKTVALTPYNGNRNDALQHIPKKSQYDTLIGLLMESNEKQKTEIEALVNRKVKQVMLPEKKWSAEKIIIDTPGKKDKFVISTFIDHLEESGLLFNKLLVKRFVASLMAKQFLILTGLSGSGKTKLAISFASWLSREYLSGDVLLKKALSSPKITETYDVRNTNKNYIELVNKSGSSGKIIHLPNKLIYEWYNALVDGTFTESDDPKNDRDKVSNDSIYQKHIHGFYNELYKIAVEMYSLSSEVNMQSHPQYLIVPVGADWTNREPLLGYPNALKVEEYVKPDNGVLDLIIEANINPHIPYFIILDEMNLSHVERYFADFLSAMESNGEIPLHAGSINEDIPKMLRLPHNLFIIGTVNIDETTYMFSPKVLDRANTIEFRLSKEEIDEFLENPSKDDLGLLAGKGAGMAEEFLRLSEAHNIEEKEMDDFKDDLLKLFEQLKKVGAEFGYRSAIEMVLLIKKLNVIDPDLHKNEKIDIAIMQKLLPKLHGSRRKLCPVLIEIGKLCLSDETISVENEIFDSAEYNYSELEEIKYPLTLEKVSRIYRSAVENGFASFAES